MPKYIDATPTWAALMPAFFAILENGSEYGRDMARKELMRLAKIVDDQNAAIKAAKAT